MLKKLFKSVREYKLPSILSIFFIIVEVIMEVFIPRIMAVLLDSGINASDMEVVKKCGGNLILVAVISLTAGALAAIFAAKASAGFGKNLRHDIFYKIQDFSFKNIDKFSSSSLITRLTTDVSNVQQAYQMLIRITFRAPLLLIFSLVMAFTVNAKIALIFLISIPVVGFFLFFLGSKAHPLFESLFTTIDSLNNTVQENVRGIRVVKSFVKEDYEKEKFGKVSYLIYDKAVKAERIVTWIGPLMELSMYTCILLIAWFGSHQISAGTLSTGELTSLFTYGTGILSSLMMVSMIYIMLTMAITSAERITEVLDETPSIRNPKEPIMEVANGSIEFKNVSFSYVDKDDKLSLKNINLSIKSGETIGIIGTTGSSKSTLVSLISRLYDVTKGEIRVGNQNVKNYDLKTLRDNVAVVLQNNVLFSGTIEENLRWGNEHATPDEIVKACDSACASEFINNLEGKYEYEITQGGTNVSGGQKQRLCIARALLKNPKIIILDDSTSAVDTATDAKIKSAFKKYIPTVTKIIIAQRISSIEHADRVIVMDNGKINAFDTPEKLLKENNIYKEVYNSQKKGVEK